MPSPSARMIAACISCSDLSTMYFCRSASCCATCLDSIAVVNSFENMRCVMDTSSRIMLNSDARFSSAAL